MSIFFDSTHPVRGSIALRPHPVVVRAFSWIDLSHGWSRRAIAPRPGAGWWALCALSVVLALAGIFSLATGPSGGVAPPPLHGPLLLAAGIAGLLGAGLVWVGRLARHGKRLLREDATRTLSRLMGHLESILSARDHAAGFVRAFPITQDGFGVGYPVHKDRVEEDLLRLWLLPAVLDATTPRKRPVLPFFQDEWEDQIEDSSGNRYSGPKERVLFAAKVPAPRSAHGRLAALMALRDLVPARAHDDFARWRAHFVEHLRVDTAA